MGGVRDIPQSLASAYEVTEAFEHASVEFDPVRPAATGLDIADDALQRPGAVSLDTDGLEFADPLQSALISSVSGFSAQSVPSSPAVDMGLSGQRLFLDICSGATRPLSQAALDVGMQVLSVDPVCAGKLDLFNNAHYEQLLRISFSGIVWFACASLACGDFSTIQLRPGPGPRSIRTCEYPLGIPDAISSQSARILSSLCLLERAASLLLAAFQAGGRVKSSLPMPYLGDRLWGSTTC